jgi:acyl-CoA thioesterase FadM
MNLVFRLVVRLLWASWRLRRDGPIGLFDTLRLRFRCLPSDLDVNLHLTNSRYFSFMDIVRIAMMIRNGAWGRIRAHKLSPVLGSSAIRYRRAVAPFQAFHVTSKVLGWDDQWLFLEHRVLIGDDDVAAVAIVKAAFLGPAGRVSTAKLLEVIGYDGQPLVPPEAAINLLKLDQSTRN